MGLFSRNTSSITNTDRLHVLELATDEDHPLSEVRARFRDVRRARETVVELLGKNMIEITVLHADRKRNVYRGDEALAYVNDPLNWQPPEPGADKVLVDATDSGWRWHQKHWKPSR